MKRITSSLLALLLALSMLIGMVPAAYAAPADTTKTEDVLDESKEVAVYAAEGNVAEVGGTGYSTLEAAISAAADGATVTLLADTTVETTLTISKALTLDLNGKTLTVSTSGDGIVVENTTLTLTNSGSTGKYVFNCSASGSDGIFVSNTTEGTVTMLNINSNVEISTTSSVNSAIHAYASNGSAVVNMNDGKIAVSGNGQFSAVIADQNSTVNVNGGEFDLNVDFESYSDRNDVVGVLAWGQNGVQKNIAVNIKGGTFKVGGKNAFAQAVQVGMKNGASENVTVNISGGNVILNPTDGGKGYVYAPYNSTYATATMTGGSVSGNVTALTITNKGEDTADLSVSDGTFTTTADAQLNVEKYVAEGSTYDSETGTVTSGSSTTAITTSEQLIAAIAAANDGDTITLGEGEFSTYGNTSPNKSLTFVGSGAGTIWTIGDLNKHTKGEANGDYSFDGCNTITFKSMKLRSDSDDYRGFIRVTNTVVEDCVLDGKTAYWGYTTASFKDCTFNAPTNDYAIWDYSSPSMTFDNCTFNGDGKAVNVYVEQPSSTERKIEIKNCKANFTKDNKSLLNIKNSNQAWDVALSGTNTVTVNGEAVADRLYQVELPTISEKTGETVKVQEEQTDGTYQTVFETTVKSDAAAKIGEKEYESLEAALKDVTLETPLTWVSDTAWPAATPVYYNGTFYATIGELLYDAQQKKGVITPEANVETAVIYCRPGATIATGSNGDHPSYVTSTTIYGNGAKLAGSTEWDVENYYTLTKDITINLYNLNGGASVWGTRKSDYTVTVNMVNCEDAHEVLFNYGSGNGKVIVTVKNSTFLKSSGAAHGWPVSINCLGSLTVERCTFDGVITGVVVNVKQPAGEDNRTMTVSVKNSTFNNVTGQDGNKGALRVTGQQECDIDLTIANVEFTGSRAEPEDITIGNVEPAKNLGKVSYEISSTDASMTVHKTGKTEAAKEEIKASETYTGNNIGKSSGDGTEANPYTLEQLGAMTRKEYIEAQTRLHGTMYVTVGDYNYDTNGVLGNGERNDTPGQTPDHSKLNAYGENGYLDAGNDGANGKNIVFVGGKITSNVTGYESIDNIGTSLLLAVPAYTNVTFRGTEFNNVMSFNYQLYTSPWSQLGKLEFDDCTFNGIIVGAIAAQTLTFNKCTFTDYTNTVSANSSNPTWIRPAYGNWTKGDNEGQGSDFKSLTTISFTGNTVTSTRPVKFERIAQWEMDTTVTATGNMFTISKQEGDTSTKNVGLYFGANAKFNLIAQGNTKSDNTAALYTAVYSAPNGKNYAGLPAGSTVKDSTDKDAVLEDAYEWKSTKKLTLKTTKEGAEVNGVKFATLAEAITAAENGKTITLLDDLTETDAANAAIVYNLTGKTLDLNGKTYTHYNFAHVFEGTGGTIKNGKMVCANGSYALFIGDKGETTNFTVDGVELTGGINIYNATGVVLKNLTVNGTNYYAVWLDEGAAATIESGTYNTGDVAAFNAAKGSALAITGGTVNTNGKTLMGESGGTLSVSGGTFDTETVKDYCADGYIPTKNADGTYGVAKAPTVAKIGETEFTSLKDAIAKAEEGATIDIVNDINTPNVSYEITKNLTIKLNGHTITADGYDAVFQIGKIADVVLEGPGSVVAVENTGSAGKYAMAVWACSAGCKVTINGEINFSQNITHTDDPQMDMIYASQGTIIINDGRYESGTPAWTLNCKDAAYKDGKANIIVNGGTFVGYDPRNNTAEGKGTSFVAAGVGVDNNTDGTFTARPNMAAQIVDADGNSVKAYEELSAAVTAADNQTVKLLQNADITAQGLTIATGKTVTLDLNGYTIEAANTNVGNIKVYGKLTLMDSTDTKKDGTGTGKITTSTPYVYNKTDKVLIAAMDGGTFIMESGLIDAASFTDDNANNGQFAVSVQNENGDAAVIINGGHIKAGWYAVAGNGTCTKHNGDITVNGGILESTADYAIYHPHTGTTTINGGTIYGAAGGVSLNRGKLVVNGGTITSKGTGSTGDWGDGTGNQDAAAINVNAQYDSTSVEIKGGTITAENNAILLTNGRNGTIAVSGGQFSHEVKAEYCAIGYQPKTTQDPNTKLYTVEKVSGNAYYVDNNGKPVYGNFVDLVNYTNDATVNKTITLLDNVTVNGYMLLFEGRSVDLSGFELTITKKLIANDGSVSDSSDGKGLLKIAADSATLVSNNGQIPLYDTDNQGYRLFNCTIKDALQTISNTSVKLWVGAIFTNKDAYKLLQTGNEHNIKIVVTLRWKNSQDTAGEQTFAFTQSLINKVALTNGEDAFYIVLTGLDTDLTGSISEVTAQGGITSGTGVSISGEEYTLTK